MAFIIAVIALVFAISAKIHISKLKEETRALRQLIETLKTDIPPNTSLSDIQIHSTTPPVQEQPSQQPSVHKPVPVPEPVAPPQKNWENLFGKNIIGAVAALLMFVGVFAFGTLIISSLSDTIKVVAQFLFAAVVIAVGVLMHKRNPSTLATSITGTGVGITYIAIFLTHIHYNLISDVVTFILILLWAMGVALMSKKLKMQALAYVALGGCIISSLLSQAYVLQQQMLVEISIYHLVMFVLLVIANKEHPLLLRLSAYSSISLNILLSCFMILWRDDTNSYCLYLCMILGAYNVAINILAYRDNRGDPQANNVIAMISHSISVFWTFIIPIQQLVMDVWTNVKDINTLQAADMDVLASHRSMLSFIVTVGLVLLAYAAQYIFIRDTHKRTNMLILAEALISGIILLSPIELVNGTELAYLLPLAIINLVLSHFSQNSLTKRKLQISGFVILLIDATTSMFFMGSWGILYSLMLFATSLAYMYVMFGSSFKFPFLQCALLNINTLVACLSVFADEYYNIALILLVLANMVWSLISEHAKKAPQVSNILQEVAESIFIFAMACVSGITSDTHEVTSCILAISLIPFALIRMRTVLANKHPFMIVWYGIKFTLCTLVALAVSTSILDEPFVVSVILMLLAVACIAFGAWKRLKPLRIYGLTVLLLGVSKMVVIDVWNQESIVRVVCLIGGALICFGISALYNKIEQLNAPQDKNI